MQTKLFVVYGACAYLRKRKIDSYIKQYGAQEVTRLTSVDDFESLCHQSDLFATKTLYVISTTDELRSLWQYICEHGASNALLFDYQGKDPSKKLLQLCKSANAVITHCPEPKPYAYRQLLASMCEEKGLQLDTTGQQTLWRACGNNLDFLHNETDKLALLFGKQNISSNDIAPHLGVLREDDVFLLTDLLQQRKYNQAQVAVERFMRQGMHALQLLGIVAYFLRNAQNTIDGERAYKSRYADSLPPSAAAITRLLKVCQQADASLKTSATSAKLTMFDVIESMRAETKA